MNRSNEQTSPNGEVPKMSSEIIEGYMGRYVARQKRLNNPQAEANAVYETHCCREALGLLTRLKAPMPELNQDWNELRLHTSPDAITPKLIEDVQLAVETIQGFYANHGGDIVSYMNFLTQQATLSIQSNQ